jgi:hypothetical protein
MTISLRYALLAPLLLSATACDNTEDADQRNAKSAAEKSIGKAKASSDALVTPAEKALGTPMAERVAIIGLLNKRNGETRDLELKPGQDIRLGKAVVRMRACERTAPWETYPDEGAFVQLIVNERPPGTNQKARWRQVFSGWIFKNNPAANVVQHPIFDVWVKECRMSFPGEEDAPVSKGSEEKADGKAPPADKKPSNAPQSPPPAGADNEDDDEPQAVEEETVVT